MFKIIAGTIATFSIISGGVWGIAGFTLTLTLLLLLTAVYLYNRESQVVIPELAIGVVFKKQGHTFARFLEPGTHWINPITERLDSFIVTSGQTARGRSQGVQAIGGIPLEVEWSLNYTLDPMRLAADKRPKMARALPVKSATIAQTHINNCLHHVINDYTIEQLIEPGAHRRLERQVRQLARVRLEPLGFNLTRMMIDAVHMPKHVRETLEAAHEREIQAENEARALERLQKVVSQFSDGDMARLIELERIHALGKNGVAMLYPTHPEPVATFSDPHQRVRIAKSGYRASFVQ